MVEYSKVHSKEEKKPHDKAREEPKKRELKSIVRVAGTDLDGQRNLYKSLIKIKGIGHTLAKVFVKIICRELNIKEDTELGNLSENQIEKIEYIIRNPRECGVKPFLFNRPKDLNEGTDKHLIMSDLSFQVRQDIEGEKNLKSWVGWRHSLGQKVHGQHTRSTGRSGMTVGVLKKAVKAQKTAAAAEAQQKGRKEEKK
ncbi:30S ribosomal protein S13 [Candidatus Micrarchaeota archaeon]|nr:30S ribosomal protein S13 [Candidatus Micrarchaeota archaeon]